MNPQALNLAGTEIPPAFHFIIYSSEHGLISEHLVEEDARASYEAFISELEFAEYLPLILQRRGEDWDIVV